MSLKDFIENTEKQSEKANKLMDKWDGIADSQDQAMLATNALVLACFLEFARALEDELKNRI